MLAEFLAGARAAANELVARLTGFAPGARIARRLLAAGPKSARGD